MINEIIFFLHAAGIALSVLGAFWLGRETLVGIICLYGVIANLFVSKQITLFGFETIATDAFIIGGIFGLNLLQEHYGREWSVKAIKANFYITVVYLIASLVHLAYSPNQFDSMQSHFVSILMPMPRIIISSVIVYVIAQYFDTIIFGALKKIFKGRYLPLRNMISMSVTQLLDTVLFTFAALYGDVHSVLSIIAVSYCIKMSVIFMTAPFTALSHFIKPCE